MCFAFGCPARHSRTNDVGVGCSEEERKFPEAEFNQKDAMCSLTKTTTTYIYPYTLRINLKITYLHSKPSNPIEGTFVRPYLRKSLRFLFLITDKGYILRTKVSFVHTKHLLRGILNFQPAAAGGRLLKSLGQCIAVRDKFLAKFEP